MLLEVFSVTLVGDFRRDVLKTRSPMYILEILGGPLDGKTWEFDDEITIGRDHEAAGACITLDRYISRRHAQLRENGGGRLLLRDLSSRNGTRLQGRAVAGEPVPIALGEPFVVGRTNLRVTRSSGEA
jgi:pSer/pThr/pTyr-binding forkhead associated (FHA) protein